MCPYSWKLVCTFIPSLPQDPAVTKLLSGQRQPLQPKHVLCSCPLISLCPSPESVLVCFSIDRGLFETEDPFPAREIRAGQDAHSGRCVMLEVLPHSMDFVCFCTFPLPSSASRANHWLYSQTHVCSCQCLMGVLEKPGVIAWVDMTHPLVDSLSHPPTGIRWSWSLSAGVEPPSLPNTAVCLGVHLLTHSPLALLSTCDSSHTNPVILFIPVVSYRIRFL